MVKLLHIKLFLLLYFLFVQLAYTQSVSVFKKAETENFSSQSSAKLTQQLAVKETELDKKETIQNQSCQTNLLTQNDNGNQSNEGVQINKTDKNFLFNYNQMPYAVQLKIDENKADGKGEFNGIVKGYAVEIKSCINSDVTKSKLAFLKDQKGFIGFDFVSSGIIKINVIPDFDSVVLKEIMLSAGVDFNFLNEYFLIDNN